MPLNIALDGAYYKDGRLVLSGQPDTDSGFDAALFLTALRAACEPLDPYFSLDPVDAAAWNTDGQGASEDFWRHIKGDLNLGGKVVAKPANAANSVTVHTVWARRDYPRLWHEISQSHPNMKAKLVFRPEWLRQTRFGEILYKGDVLLKELSEGVPLLGVMELRAGAIQGYISASERRVTRGLSSVFEDGVSENISPKWQSNRLWFDLVPPPPDQMFQVITEPGLGGSELARLPDNPMFRTPTSVDWLRQATTQGTATRPPKNPKELAKLQSVLRGRSLLPVGINTKLLESRIVKDADALDISHIYPRMFVRRTKDGKDIQGYDPDLDGLSYDINQRIEKYVGQYRELQILNELFRAYIVAVQITKQNESLCNRLKALPLLDAERLSVPAPEFHPSELFITVGMYEYSVPKGRALLSTSAASVNGGVSIGGKSYTAAHIVEGGTLLTQNLNQMILHHPDEASWNANDRQFVAFNVESGLPVVQGQANSQISKYLNEENTRGIAVSSKGQGSLGQGTNSTLGFILVLVFLLIIFRHYIAIIVYSFGRTFRLVVKYIIVVPLYVINATKRLLRGGLSSAEKISIENEFRRVFANRTDEYRERVVSDKMKLVGYSRHEAMRVAALEQFDNSFCYSPPHRRRERAE
jgi:hypothetical protein